MMETARQYILHSAHEWYGDGPHIQWAEATATLRRKSFRASNIGNCLFLKLCGFIDSEQARVQDVSENHLHLQLGGSQLRSLISQENNPLDLEIQLSPVESESNPESEVQVTIRDRRWRQRPFLFETAARRAILHLQDHLMANH